MKEQRELIAVSLRRKERKRRAKRLKQELITRLM